uniref:Uncharacterized protein n=1 Tax=viral metagenome TaxID=1070528 RepID=A0A6C0DS53_9ZZZZ
MVEAYGYRETVIDDLAHTAPDEHLFYNYRGLKFLAKLKSANYNLVISFHGSLTQNGNVITGGKDRVIFRGFDYTIDNTDIVCIMDYLVGVYDEYVINWTLSTELHNVEHLYLEIFQKIIHAKPYRNVIFTGCSAGGYPALKFACKFEKIALISNSQLYLERFHTRSANFNQVKTMVEASGDRLLYSACDIEKLIQVKKPVRIILYNNVSDDTYKLHTQPFVEFIKQHGLEHLLDLRLFEWTTPLPEGKTHHTIQFPENRTPLDVLKSLLV